MPQVPQDQKMIRYIQTLPGKSVTLYFASNGLNFCGLSCIVDDVEWDASEFYFSIRPVNQAPWVVEGYTKIRIHPGGLLIAGGEEETWALRIDRLEQEGSTA